MPELYTFVKIGLYVLMGVCALGAIAAVSLPNIFHAALCLIVALVGTAGIYIALHAEFLAVVQILLYVGAVMTLVIFSIMMTERFADKTIPSKNNLSLPAIALSLFFLVLLVRLVTQTPWIQRQTGAFELNTADLGISLLTTYAFPFEVISVFLIAVLIGAIVVAKKDKS